MPIRHNLFFPRLSSSRSPAPRSCSARQRRSLLALALLGVLGTSVAPSPMQAHAEPASGEVRTLESSVDTPALDPVEQLPDLRQHPAGPERKAAFLELLVPLVEAENAKIQAQRDWLLEARERQASLSAADREHLQRLCADYGIECGTPNTFEYLLSRVDTLPLEMVVIQAVEESGWGHRALPGATTYSVCAASAKGAAWRRKEAVVAINASTAFRKAWRTTCTT